MKVAIINCFETYEVRENWVKSFFINRGDDVTIIKSNFLHMKKKKCNEYRKDAKYVDVLPYKRNFSFGRLKSHYNFSKKVLCILKQNEYDLIYVLIPPNSLVKQCSKYKSSFGGYLIFDVIDLWPETMPIPIFKNYFPFSLWGKIRNKYIDNADAVVTQCELYQEILCKHVPDNKMYTIYMTKNYVQRKINLNLCDEEIHLCYLGSINNIIDIAKIGEVISFFKSFKPVILKIIGDGEKKEELIKTAEICGAKIIDYGKVYDDEKKQTIFDTCHYGLNIYKENTCIGMTMKSLDYLYGKLPIINNISSDTENIIEKYQVGINLKNLKRINDITNQSRIYRKNIDFCISEVLSIESANLKLKESLSKLENRNV